MQKAVLRVEWGNERERKKAMKTISAYEGIQSVAVDMDMKKVTVIGDMDPVQLVENLRKRFDTDIEYLGPKEPKTEKPKPDTNINSPNNAYPEHVAYDCHGYPLYPPPSYYYPPSAPPYYYS